VYRIDVELIGFVLFGRIVRLLLYTSSVSSVHLYPSAAMSVDLSSLSSLPGSVDFASFDAYFSHSHSHSSRSVAVPLTVSAPRDSSPSALHSRRTPDSSASAASSFDQSDSESEFRPLVSPSPPSGLIELSRRVDSSRIIPDFSMQFKRELNRVNNDYLSQLRSLEGRFQSLSEVSLSPLTAKSAALRLDDSIRAKFIDFYRDLIYLQNFVAFNGIAFDELIHRASSSFPSVVSVSESGGPKELESAIDQLTRELSQTEFYQCSEAIEASKDPQKRKASFGRANSQGSLQEGDLNRLNFLAKNVESMFASLYCGSNKLLAHNVLHEKIRSSMSDSSAVSDGLNWHTFDLGMRFGILLLLLTWVMWDVIVDARLRPSHAPIWVKSVLPVYRGLGVILFFGWLYGCNLWIWRRYRLNYIAIFDLDPANAHTHSQVFLKCMTLTTAFLVNFLIYFKMLRGDFPEWFPSGSLPVSLFVYILYSLSPSAGAKNIIWNGFLEVIRAPFGKVNFLTNYIGDVITSLVRPTVDLAYSVCFTLSFQWLQDIDEPSAADRFTSCLYSPIFKRLVVPLLSALPLWLRLMQCLRKYMETKKRWPFLGNALKYGLSHSIVLFSVMHAAIQDVHYSSTSKNIFYLCFIISTLYAFFWDVAMDWNLGWQRYAGLRESLIYQNPTIYYACIVLDLMLRFSWTLTLIPQGEDSMMPVDFILYLQPFLAAAEVFRRCMWGCLRVEHEHLSTQSHLQQNEKDSTDQKGKIDENRTGRQQIIEVILIAGVVLSLGAVAVLTAN
jgi:hypothetical protein